MQTQPRPWRGFLFQYRGFLAGSGGVASAMQLAMNASFSGCASAGLTSSDWTKQLAPRIIGLRSLFSSLLHSRRRCVISSGAAGCAHVAKVAKPPHRDAPCALSQSKPPRCSSSISKRRGRGDRYCRCELQIRRAYLQRLATQGVLPSMTDCARCR